MSTPPAQPDFRHVTVLAREAIELLAPRPGGLYCDGTVGGGGHAERILEASAPDGRVIGIDRDPAALAAAGARLARFGDRVTLVHGVFGDMRRILADVGVAVVDGILLDLGISSPQVDLAERGFSFMREGPLDMRMDTTQGETCGDLLRRIGGGDLARLIRRYGEDPYAKKIAYAIKDAVADHRVHTTTELAAVIAAALPERERQHRKTDPATRTFQALRIAVNDELTHVERFLADFLELLRPSGGRLVVIAFHSLEDHLVKNRLRDLSRHPGMPEDIARSMGIRPDPEIDLLTRHPVVPSDDEIAQNPRARSAKLRAAVRR